MYIITIDDDFLFGTGKYERPGYEIIKPKVSQAVNTAGAFTFTIYPEHPRYNDVNTELKIIKITKEGVDEPLFRGRVLNTEYGFFNEKLVTCEGELAFLCDIIQRPLAGGTFATPRDQLKYLIDRYNGGKTYTKYHFNVGNVTVNNGGDPLSIVEEAYLNTFEAIQKYLIDRFGGYISVRHESDGNYIDYLEQPSETSSQKIEFGKNLLSIKKNIDTESIATVVIPVGKQGSGSAARVTIKGYNPNVENERDIVHTQDRDCMYSKSAVDQYGWIEKVLIYDDVQLLPVLYRNGKAFLMQINAATSIDVTAADLSGTGLNIDSFKIGQFVRVNSAPHNLHDAIFIVSKLDIDLTNPAANKLTLGKKNITLTEQLSGGGSSSAAIVAGGGGGNYDPAGSASVALQDAKDYADGRDAEMLAAALDYTDDHTYTHPAYAAIEVNRVTGTKHITPGTQFTLPWFGVNATGHVYQNGLGYYNVGHDDSKVDVTDYNAYQETINTSISDIGADIDGLQTSLEGKANAEHTHKYAGSDSSGGAADSANKLNSNAGSGTKPVYFDNGIPHACNYNLGSMAAKDSNDYLPKTGGTLTPGSSITIPRSTDGRSTKLDGGSMVCNIPAQEWSMGIGYKGGDEAILGGIKAYGWDNHLQYYYMGADHKNTDFMFTPSSGTITAQEFKRRESGTLLADTYANANSVSVTNVEIAKYSTVYMAAAWTERERIDFSAVIPIADIIAGATYSNYTCTSTRRYWYTVTCTSAGVFTLAVNNSDGITATIRLKLYVI